MLRVRNGLNSQQLEKEDFSNIEGHVVYKIIKREEADLSGKRAVKIRVFVGPPEDYKENSGTIYVYSDINSQESLSIRQLGMDSVQFDQILSTFKFLDNTGKFCGGIAANLPENQCPVGYVCKLDGNYPDASGKCVKKIL